MANQPLRKRRRGSSFSKTMEGGPGGVKYRRQRDRLRARNDHIASPIRDAESGSGRDSGLGRTKRAKGAKGKENNEKRKRKEAKKHAGRPTNGEAMNRIVTTEAGGN